ncbi:hypothetical protein NDU88_005823 [Pleurodeles waltl]|uniref:Uncharacterized protein n=1 Tax=Pleurodeles waltl TaxID=8319 RepID=A0AAV7QJC5_PLEWA|nr:hypothetical protein NDU88_005823 [Pleurodeles waltl]
MPPRRIPDTPLMLRLTLPSPCLAPPAICASEYVRTVHFDRLGSVLLLVLLPLPWGQSAVAPRCDCRAT